MPKTAQKDASVATVKKQGAAMRDCEKKSVNKILL